MRSWSVAHDLLNLLNLLIYIHHSNKTPFTTLDVSRSKLCFKGGEATPRVGNKQPHGAFESGNPVFFRAGSDQQLFDGTHLWWGLGEMKGLKGCKGTVICKNFPYNMMIVWVGNLMTLEKLPYL